LEDFLSQERMHIFETTSEKSLEKFRKICTKALTLSQERKLYNNNKRLQRYALLTRSLDVIYGAIYYLHGIAVKLRISK